MTASTKTPAETKTRQDGGRVVDLYFDFISPYAYFGWQATRKWAQSGVTIRPIPVVFAGLLQAHGQLGPAEIPAKRAFVGKDCLRIAAKLGVPFAFPIRHPFRSIEALRLSLPLVAGDRQADVIAAIWRAGWGLGRDIGDPEQLAEVLDGIGLDGAAMLAKTRSAEAKIALTQNTKAAIGAGVFGVPTCAVQGELIWGHDRLDDVQAVLEGRDAFKPEDLPRVADRLAGVQRKRTPRPSPSKRDHPRRAFIEEIFNDAAFVKAMGVQVRDVGQGTLTTTMMVCPEHTQQDGYVHAGALATLADHTAGGAAGTVVAQGRRPLSIEFKINMLRPALGPTLRCDAKVLQAGHRIVVVESWVYGGEDEALVAKATVTLKAARIST